MKTYKNLYAKIYDFENLYQAYLCARKKREYKNQVLVFTAHLEENLISIQNELIYQTYHVGKYQELYVYEPKKRLVMALPFRDRVVQWAIFRVISPIFARGYIHDSYASIKGKGPQSTAKRIQYWLRLLENKSVKSYYLKMDCAKFFYRISHETILAILSRKIADQKVMWLFRTIVNSEDTAFGLPLGCINIETTPRLYNVGMPIGNLTSQMMANIYMNEVDQYCKRKLRIRFYMRYMDDMLILSGSKQRLHEYKRLVEQFLNDNLKLELNNKTAIRPCTMGIDFCGYRVWADHVKLRKRTALRIKRHLKYVQEQYSQGKMPLEKANDALKSCLGSMKHFDSYHLKRKILKNFVLVRKDPPD